MEFRPNHTFHRFITTGCKFIALNWIYLVSCLPIITIGVATTSLMSATLKYAFNEDDHFFKNYFKTWKASWLISSGTFFLLVVLSIALSFCTLFWFNFNSFLGIFLGLIAFSLSLYIIVAICFSFALIARFDNSFFLLIKLTLTLPLVSLGKSLGILIILVAVICCIILFPLFKVLFILFGFSFIAYCLSFLILSVFKQTESS